MTDSNRDPLLEQLRELPDPPLPTPVNARIRNRAVHTLVSYHQGPAWLLDLGRFWSNVGVPVALSACGLFYLVAGWSTLARVYGPGTPETMTIESTATDGATAMISPTRVTSRPALPASDNLRQSARINW